MAFVIAKYPGAENGLLYTLSSLVVVVQTVFVALYHMLSSSQTVSLLYISNLTNKFFLGPTHLT